MCDKRPTKIICRLGALAEQFVGPPDEGQATAAPPARVERARRLLGLGGEEFLGEQEAGECFALRCRPLGGVELAGAQ